MSLGDIPLGKIQHMQVIGPVLDEAEIKEIVAHIERGNLPSMMTLILHNQMVMSKRLFQAPVVEETYDKGGEKEVSEPSGDTGKRARKKTS